MNKPGKMRRSALLVYKVLKRLLVNGPEHVSNHRLLKECGFGSTTSMDNWLRILKNEKLIFTKWEPGRAGTGRRYISLHEEVGAVPR